MAEALVLTHEDSKKEHMDTYLRDKLRPVRPLLCYGRAAFRSPKVEVNKAVWYWWQDCHIHSTVSMFLCLWAPDPGMFGFQ